MAKFKVGDSVRVVEGAFVDASYRDDCVHVVTAVTDEWVYLDGAGLDSGRGQNPVSLYVVNEAGPVSVLDRIKSEGERITSLCAEKNKAYGSSFEKTGAFLRLLYPDGIKPEQYEDLGLIFRVFDKQMRIATRKDAFGESPFADIAGYGILGAAKDSGAKK
jgi:hypothetical protein